MREKRQFECENELKLKIVVLFRTWNSEKVNKNKQQIWTELVAWNVQIKNKYEKKRYEKFWKQKLKNINRVNSNYLSKFLMQASLDSIADSKRVSWHHQLGKILKPTSHMWATPIKKKPLTLNLIIDKMFTRTTSLESNSHCVQNSLPEISS